MSKIMNIGMVISALLFAYCAYEIYRRRKNRTIQINYNQKNNPFAYALYRILSTHKITKKYYTKLKNRYSTLYPGDDTSVDRKVTKMLFTSFLICMAFTALLFVIGKGDIFYSCLAIWAGFVIFTYSINLSFENLEGKLLTQFANYVSDLRHFYHETNMVDDAIYEAMQDAPREMALHAGKFHEMVDSPDTMELVDKYAQKAPNRFFTIFAAVCASIKEYGDTIVDDVPLFLTNLNFIKEEINIEQLKRKKIQRRFSGMIIITLVPVFLLKPLEMWMGNNLPETSNYYQGAGGTISTVAIFLGSFLCYTMVSALKDGTKTESEENVLLKKIAKLPVVNQLIIRIENHNYSKTLKLSDDLKSIGDKSGTRAFLVKQFIAAIACFILCNAVAFVVLEKQQVDLLTNFTNAFENSVVPNDDYRYIMEETAKEYTKYKSYIAGEDEQIAQEELAKKITEEKGMKPVYAKDVAQVVYAHSKALYNSYYKWWILVLSIAGGVAGFYIPKLMLKYQCSIARMNMEDEVVQFQTLMLILMHHDGITIDVILDWMERFSFCFKDSIQKCIINLPYGQQDALIELRNSESFPPFKRFVDNLLAIDDADVSGAFDEIKTERDYYNKKREEDNDKMIAHKGNIGMIITFIPFYETLVLHVIVPFAIFVMNMSEQTNIVLK